MFTPIRRATPTCQSCHKRPALACVRGSWRVIKHHDVCRQCWRGFVDSGRAARVRRRAPIWRSEHSRSFDTRIQGFRHGVETR
jgi:hypothetical protein